MWKVDLKRVDDGDGAYHILHLAHDLSAHQIVLSEEELPDLCELLAEHVDTGNDIHGRIGIAEGEDGEIPEIEDEGDQPGDNG